MNLDGGAGAVAVWEPDDQGSEITLTPVSVTLLFFAAAREAAGTAREAAEGTTVGEVLLAAEARHGSRLAAVVARSRVWVNGEPAERDALLSAGDEVAVLPPVSGGA